MIDYKLENICSYTALLAAAREVIGPVPEGIKANFYVTGSDWLTLRRDGVALLDVRATIETHDGALNCRQPRGFGRRRDSSPAIPVTTSYFLAQK